MIWSGSAVQTNGLGCRLVSATKRLIVAWRSTIEVNTRRLSRRLASLAKKPSTALSHEDEVGVKWNVQRLCRSSQAWTQPDRARRAGRQDDRTVAEARA